MLLKNTFNIIINIKIFLIIPLNKLFGIPFSNISRLNMNIFY